MLSAPSPYRNPNKGSNRLAVNDHYVDMAQISSYVFTIMIDGVNPQQPYIALSYTFGPNKLTDFYQTRMYTFQNGFYWGSGGSYSMVLSSSIFYNQIKTGGTLQLSELYLSLQSIPFTEVTIGSASRSYIVFEFDSAYNGKLILGQNSTLNGLVQQIDCLCDLTGANSTFTANTCYMYTIGSQDQLYVKPYIALYASVTASRIDCYVNHIVNPSATAATIHVIAKIVNLQNRRYDWDTNKPGLQAYFQANTTISSFVDLSGGPYTAKLQNASGFGSTVGGATSPSLNLTSYNATVWNFAVGDYIYFDLSQVGVSPSGGCSSAYTSCRAYYQVNYACACVVTSNPVNNEIVMTFAGTEQSYLVQNYSSPNVQAFIMNSGRTAIVYKSAGQSYPSPVTIAAPTIAVPAVSGN